MAHILVVVLQDGGHTKRILVEEAYEVGGSLVGVGAAKQVKARFNMKDIRSWYVEDEEDSGPPTPMVG
jgi:hypothetical protein